MDNFHNQYPDDTSDEFTVEDGVLIEYAGGDENVVIPADLGITTIGSQAFAGCEFVESVVIPESVTKIEGGAFWGTHIASPILINDQTPLSYVPPYYESYVIPDSVTSIGDEAFMGCRLTSIKIPFAVEKIGDGAFAGCANLTTVLISENVTSIGDDAFKDCSSLTTITIPDSLVSVGAGAFDGTSLSAPVIINRGRKLVYVPADYVSYTVPETVIEIDGQSFAGCELLESIEIPDSVSVVGDSAFLGTSLPEPILINNGQTLCYVPDNYQTYTIDDTVKSINAGAFAGCLNLESVVIPASVTTIEDSAFAGCCSLESIAIPASVAKIGEFAFSGTNLPEPVISNDGKTLCYVPLRVKSFTIPATVTAIAAGAFENCSNLRSITIPDAITEIRARTFAFCERLTDVTIPESVTAIGGGAFSCCYNLQRITIPASVTKIGFGAFSGCEKLMIAGAEGTFADVYATRNNIDFEVFSD